jgi:hypothetical protein
MILKGLYDGMGSILWISILMFLVSAISLARPVTTRGTIDAVERVAGRVRASVRACVQVFYIFAVLGVVM